MKVLTVDNHPNLREEMASMITDHPYWLPDPRGFGQSGDPAVVSPIVANRQGTPWRWRISHGRI